MYNLYIDENPLGINLDAALEYMSEQRRKQVLAFRHERGRKLSAAAYMLLCKALKEVYGINEPPLFEYSEHGKPSIVGHPEIYFNISHCRSVTGCVVSSCPVGIDVEEVREYKESLARYVLNDDEYSMVSSSRQPAREFIRLWTMKESYLKLTSKGIYTVKRKSSMHNYATKIRNREKRRVQIQDTGSALASKRPTS